MEVGLCPNEGCSAKEKKKYYIYMPITTLQPITMAVRSKVPSDFGIVGSNPTQTLDVSLRLFCICVVLCVGSGLAKG
jgi:hypothetical protein